MLEVTELVGKLRDGGNVVLVAVRDYLGVCLGELTKRCGFLQQVKEEVSVNRWEGCDYASTVHPLEQVFDAIASRILLSCPAS